MKGCGPLWPSMLRASRRLQQNGVARWGRSRRGGRLRVLVKGVPLQRIRGRAGQVPHDTRGNEVKVHLTVDSPLRHQVDNRGAEATSLWPRYGRPVTLSPVDRENVVIK